MVMAGGGISKAKVATVIVAVDGSGDFTDIQSALNFLGASGGAVYIKEGSYSISSVLIFKGDGTSLIGSGRKTWIQLAYDGICIDTGGYSNFLISDLYLKGLVAGTAGVGIRTNGAVIGFIINVFIDTFSLRGIEITSGGISVLGCDIFMLKGQSIYIGAWRDVRITGNYILNYDDYAIYLDGASYNSITGNTIKGLEDAETGIFLTNSDKNVISGNVVRGFDSYGIDVSDATCDKNVIVGNGLTDNTTGAFNDAGTGTEISHNTE